MHRAGRRASKVNGCRRVHTSAKKKKRRSSERRNINWSGHKGLMDALRAPLSLGLKPSGEFLKTAHWAVFLTEFHLIGSSPATCSKNGKRRLGLEPHSSQRQRAEARCPRLPRRMAKRTWLIGQNVCLYGTCVPYCQSSQNGNGSLRWSSSQTALSPHSGLPLPRFGDAE